MLTWQQNLTIRTEEGVHFSYMLASPLTRFLAVLIDWIVIILISALLQNVLLLASLISLDLAQAAIMLSGFILGLGYPMLCEWRFRGQTLGKRLLRIRVVDAGGLNLTLPQVIVRNLLRAVDVLPACYLVGGAVAALSPRAQRLGDLVAATVVIQHLPAFEPDLQQLRASKYNSLRDYPHLCARVRQHTSPQEAAIAADAILRRDHFDDDARIDLFHELRQHFTAKVSFPESALHGLSDERFVRNIVDVLFDRQRPTA